MGKKHFIEVCACGVVLNQCRCMSLDKERRVSARPCIHKPDLAARLAAERARFDAWCGRHGYGHSPGLTDADKAWIDMRLAVRWEAWLAALGLDP